VIIVDSACKCCAAAFSHHQFQFDNHFMLYITGIAMESAVLSLLPPHSNICHRAAALVDINLPLKHSDS